MPNCRHPRGEERRSGPLLPLQLSPPPPPQPVSAGLTLSLVTRAGARPPQGQADSTVCSCHWPPCPTPGPSPAPLPLDLGASGPPGVHCLLVFFPRALPSEKYHSSPWGTPRRRQGGFSSAFRALGLLACLGNGVCAGVCVCMCSSFISPSANSFLIFCLYAYKSLGFSLHWYELSTLKVLPS